MYFRQTKRNFQRGEKMNYTLPDDSLHQEIQISPYLSNGIIDRSEDVQTQRDYKFPFFYFRDFNKAL